MNEFQKNFVSRGLVIEKLLRKGKVLVIYGPRRVGKTTLVQEFLSTTKLKYLLESGDSIPLQELLGSQDFSKILPHVSNIDLYVLDEAQQVGNIGMGLKIIVDQVPNITVIAIGSSSFDLADKIGEPLVGRKFTYTLYPISLYELAPKLSRWELNQKLNELLIYGSYPQIITAANFTEKKQIVKEIADSYLLKDIFRLAGIQAPRQLLHLLKLLAFQIGQPVSLNELSNETGLNLNTVRRYLDLLEKTFVLVRIDPYARNLRNALKFKSKYFFWDTGIRNAIIDNFNTLDKRDDIGNLWENFCIIERMKRNAYAGDRTPHYYFYRSYNTNQEIDLVEEYNGYTAFECKWSAKKRSRKIPDWSYQYPDSPISVIHSENYLDYLI